MVESYGFGYLLGNSVLIQQIKVYLRRKNKRMGGYSKRQENKATPLEAMEADWKNRRDKLEGIQYSLIIKSVR